MVSLQHKITLIEAEIASLRLVYQHRSPEDNLHAHGTIDSRYWHTVARLRRLENTLAEYRKELDTSQGKR